MPFFLALLVSAVLTFFIGRLAAKQGFVDFPSPRKVHKKPIPRLGGVAIFLSFWLLVFSLLRNFEPRLVGVFLGSVILVIFGIIDDIKNLSPATKLLGQIAAILVVLFFGLGIDYLRTPFGNVFYFSQILSLFFTGLWILVLVNSMNFLDGLDGLAAGISTIAALILFFLASRPPVSQWDLALMTIVLAGATLGFLLWNFNPASIFMGDSGSQFLGFMLAVLAVIAGGKIATALLVLGVPIFDAFWAILRRLFLGKSPFLADRQHLHHRLLSIGLPQRLAVIFLWVLALVFGVFALLGNNPQEKIRAGLWLLAILFSLAFLLVLVEWKRGKRNARISF
ncbi:undecaprenyl/decaprenyl-phosphate alpha-N-acetylglucosaminyl 1-phosphate transferase [Candidatus Berkelbacteria bacterium]|nr:undecaprenyl/decaprenyl-phosphate alpha-N-acetylglucosaminyl 1-phosphate transferase [Candidatus Berkelbacteria bacterium]